MRWIQLQTTRIVILTTIIFAAGSMTTRAQCTGVPFNGTAQTIPGRIQCEFYDKGGEGVGYHDKDTINHGSGHLNPANGSSLNEFRMNEGADISFTKSNAIDNNPFNKVEPEMNQLYVGWTEPGEWTHYSVDVKSAGVYSVSLMYTANTDGAISISLDGRDVAGVIHVPTTHRSEDTVAWRQWHHWNNTLVLDSLALTAGKHCIRLTSVSGNMNYDYLEFILHARP